MTHPLLQQLASLPDTWPLVAVDGNKRPYQPAWQQNPLTKDQVASEIRAGRARAVGLIAGPTSGLMMLDHDGISATQELERLGLPLSSLPPTVAMTSRRDGRFQLVYRVPEQYWPSMRGRRVFRTGKLDATGKAEQLELRWHGHQSVVIGHHPDTEGYIWCRGRSPSEQPIADAPTALIELLLDEPPAPPTQQPALPMPPPPTTDTVPFLDFISRTSRDLIETGGTPGAWNDDQLKLALDLRGTESWIIAQGHRPDITASQAFALHIAAAASKARDFDESKALHRFNGADNHNPRPSTPDDKLRSRLQFHTKKEARRPQQAPSHDSPSPQHTPAPTLSKPAKLEAGELLLHLRRTLAADGNLRWNTFTGSIELNGAAIDGAERFYLTLAEQGHKVSKDLALDCLITVAKENQYDPVTEYLDHVAATVQPAFINSLASTYLRPDDNPPGPTLYDHMLRCTLIGAVRRAFEPGSKHDTACVLMGDQGARKSSFWAALGGPFFSDSLSDCTSKDDLMKLHRSWIMEWAELDHIVGRRQSGIIKSFLTQSTDLFRVPYGRATEAHPRRGIIVGSTNRTTGFLDDTTGNRRFWVIPVTCNAQRPIDTGSLALERDSIWAAAVHAYRAGERSWLPPELDQQVTDENESYQLANPWQPAIEAWLAQRMPGEVITSESILLHAIEKPLERQTRQDQMAVADILRSLGYVQQRSRANGQRVRRWLPPP
jgi:hypothetical protein